MILCPTRLVLRIAFGLVVDGSCQSLVPAKLLSASADDDGGAVHLRAVTPQLITLVGMDDFAWSARRVLYVVIHRADVFLFLFKF